MQKALIILFSFLITLGFAMTKHAATPAKSEYSNIEASLPLRSEVALPSLNTIENQALQAALRSELSKNPTYKKLIRQKKLALGLLDMQALGQERYASINGREMMYAASLPKIAVLLAATQAIEDGELELTNAVRKDMHLMIRKSNNAASTRMIDRVGYAKIAEVMQDPDYNLYNAQEGGGLWVGKRYAAGGARNPDPLKGLSHAASVEKVCRYYYLLAKEKLVSEKGSKLMKACLVNPGLSHKFVNTLSRLAPKAKLYRKSGSWKSFHSDSVWVKGPDRNYVLVALIDDTAGEHIARDLVHVAERAMSKAQNKYSKPRS